MFTTLPLNNLYSHTDNSYHSKSPPFFSTLSDGRPVNSVVIFHHARIGSTSLSPSLDCRSSWTCCTIEGKGSTTLMLANSHEFPEMMPHAGRGHLPWTMQKRWICGGSQAHEMHACQTEVTPTMSSSIQEEVLENGWTAAHQMWRLPSCG